MDRGHKVPTDRLVRCKQIICLAKHAIEAAQRAYMKAAMALRDIERRKFGQLYGSSNSMAMQEKTDGK